MTKRRLEKKYFLVSIHDVAAPFVSQVCTILDNVTDLVGSELSLAVTPNWHDKYMLDSSDISRITEKVNGDIVVHGMYHQRAAGYGPVSLLTRRSDEFNGLECDVALQLARTARTQIEDIFGVSSLGFVPPAWQFGKLTTTLLFSAGFQFVLSYFNFYYNLNSGARSLPLANYSWDNGRPSSLGHVGHLLGAIMSHLPARIPCFTFHPNDVLTGFDRVGYRLIQQLILESFIPVRPSRLMGEI